MTADEPSIGMHNTPRRHYDSSSIRTEFGFDLDDNSWLRQLREYGQTAALGRISSYELLEVIGRGGHGVVFKARQPGTGRIIAVKRLSAGAFASSEVRARFEREVEAASALDHPGIVTVLGSEISGGQQLLAMKLIDGVSIDRWSSPPDAAHRDVDSVLRVFVQVCDAVHHAHQRGVIHRDLKPSNILVDANGRTHVLDFGLAKFETQKSMAASITVSGAFLGTPAYAAPEQVRGDNRLIDTRTDIYALGSVLYRLLVNQPVFEETADLSKLIQNILYAPPRIPSTLNPRLNRELDAIILKALAKEKHIRYPSVDALSQDIQRFLNGQAVLAHPPSRIYRLRKFVRQHRGGVAVTVGFVGLLLAATAASTSYYLEASEQTQVALREATAQRAINSFLDGIINRANPNSRLEDRDITLREALRLTAAEFNEAESTYPFDVEAKLRKSIANALFGVGSIREALPIAQKAVALSRQAVSEGMLPCFDCYSMLCRIQSTLGEYAQALETELEALRILDEREDLIAEHRPQVLRWLTLMQFLNGDLKSAEVHARQALGECRNEDPLVVLPVRLLLGRIVANNHPDYEGEALARSVLDFNRQRGFDGREAAVPLARLAAIVRERGDLNQAYRLIQEAIELHRQVRGVFHHDELWMQIELALIYMDRGEFEQAEEILRKVSELCVDMLGNGSKVTIDARTALGTILHRKGDDAAALTLLSDVLATCREKFGTDHIHTARIEASLAPVLAKLGKAEEAEQLFRHALQIRREVLGTRSETATNIHELGVFLQNYGRNEEARNLLEEALAMRRSVRGEDHFETAETLRVLSVIRDQ